jgi:3-oxoacyl-[acyl-carrier-protein] synthase II
VSSTQRTTGHRFGAAGAVEAFVCAKALSTGWLPPTINYEVPDPECDLDYVPNTAREWKPSAAISNSFGLGGHNASLIFTAYNE